MNEGLEGHKIVHEGEQNAGGEGRGRFSATRDSGVSGSLTQPCWAGLSPCSYSSQIEISTISLKPHISDTLLLPEDEYVRIM